MYAIEMAFLDAAQCGASQHLYLGGQDLGTYLGTVSYILLLKFNHVDFFL